MWYHLLMHQTGDRYEAVLPGKMPDAFMIEVGDTPLGFPGYVSSLPQKLTERRWSNDVRVVLCHDSGNVTDL